MADRCPLRGLAALLATCAVMACAAACPAGEQTLIQHDWRMQDGIDTAREPTTYAAAVEHTLSRGDLLVADLRQSGVAVAGLTDDWQAARAEWQRMSKDGAAAEAGKWNSLSSKRRQARLAFSHRSPASGSAAQGRRSSSARGPSPLRSSL